MWQSDGERRIWRSDDVSLGIDPTRPELGVGAIRLGRVDISTLVPLQLKAIHRHTTGQVPEEADRLSEEYIRENDLVAVYTESSLGQFVPQVYWRMLDSTDIGRIAALDIMVSVQTSLLDSTATVVVTTHFGPGELLRCELQADGRVGQASPLDRSRPWETSVPTLTLFRPADLDWSYAEMVYPTDFCSMQLAASEDAADWNRVQSTLFSERLEKGVIRRGRLRAVWLTRSRDESLLRAEYSDFFDAPLPLTT